MNGKKWRVHVYEKMGPCEVKVFDSKEVACRLFGRQSGDCTLGLRPQRAISFLEDWLVNNSTFVYELHAIGVNRNWFSLDSIGRGLKKIGEIFNQPLVFKEKKD